MSTGNMMFDMLLDEVRPYAFSSNIEDIQFEDITPIVHRIFSSISDNDAEKIVKMLISVIKSEKKEKPVPFWDGWWPFSCLSCP